MDYNHQPLPQVRRRHYGQDRYDEGPTHDSHLLHGVHSTTSGLQYVYDPYRNYQKSYKNEELFVPSNPVAPSLQPSIPFLDEVYEGETQEEEFDDRKEASQYNLDKQSDNKYIAFGETQYISKNHKQRGNHDKALVFSEKATFNDNDYIFNPEEKYFYMENKDEKSFNQKTNKQAQVDRTNKPDDATAAAKNVQDTPFQNSNIDSFKNTHWKNPSFNIDSFRPTSFEIFK